MTRQVEPATQVALALRSSTQTAVGRAFADPTLFPQVPAQPYLNAPQGPQGFPDTTAMETKGLTFYGTDTPPGTAQDVASIHQQINVLESFRRSELTRRQTKRELLSHLAYEYQQAPLHNAAALQVFVGIDKVRTS